MSADVVPFPRRPLPPDLGPAELELLGPWAALRVLARELDRIRLILLERPALIAQLPAAFEADLVTVYDEADALATLIAEHDDERSGHDDG